MPSLIERVHAIDTAARRERINSPGVIQAGPGGASGVSGDLRRAKTQEAATADGKISVKFVDANGTQYGSAFDVYAFASKVTTGDAADMRQFGPHIASGEYVWIVKDSAGDWILLEPQLTQAIPLRAQTQAAAGANPYISVKLLSVADAEIGDAFNAYFIFSDAGTVANGCLPRVASGKTILISKAQGTWYIVNPTLIKSTSNCPE